LPLLLLPAFVNLPSLFLVSCRCPENESRIRRLTESAADAKRSPGSFRQRKAQKAALFESRCLSGLLGTLKEIGTNQFIYAQEGEGNWPHEIFASAGRREGKGIEPKVRRRISMSTRRWTHGSGSSLLFAGFPLPSVNFKI